MVEGFSGRQREILPDGSSAGYIQHLHAAADGQDWFAGTEDLSHKPDMEQIDRDICTAIPGAGIFSGQKRGNVLTAAEKKAVAELYIFTEKPVTAHDGDDERQPFRVADGLDVRVRDELAVAVKAADNDSDLWFHDSSMQMFLTAYVKKGKYIQKFLIFRNINLNKAFPESFGTHGYNLLMIWKPDLNISPGGDKEA